MERQTATELVRAPELLTLFAGDPFFERAQEINDLIARRAYELFESKGFTHCHDLQDWLDAESEILLTAPVEVTETETELTIRAEVPGFSEKDLEIRVASRSLCILYQYTRKVVYDDGKKEYEDINWLNEHIEKATRRKQ